VTYKWPEWLTQQTQKQRIIWGYKILFLDVLFPLNIKKVYMYGSVYVYIYACIHTYIYINIYIYIYTSYISGYIRRCGSSPKGGSKGIMGYGFGGKTVCIYTVLYFTTGIYVYMYTHTFTHQHTYTQETLGFQFWRQGYWAEHLRLYLYIHICIYIYIYIGKGLTIYMYVYIYVHIYI
jgi:hypothetical protein